jgi:hypothetical protein
MKSGSSSILTGAAVLALAAMSHAAEPANPANPALPAGANPAALAPAAPGAPARPAGGDVSEARARKMKAATEMRELSLKLKPVLERVQNDAELLAAIANLKQAQDAVNALREAKMRADPEAAKLLDRMDVLRKELSGPGLQPFGRPGPDGAMRTLPPHSMPKPVAPGDAPKTP